MTKPSNSNAPARRSSLWLVAALLAGSALIRATESCSDLIFLAAQASQAEEAEGEKMDPPAGNGPESVDLAEILEELAIREERVAAREALMEDRMAALALAVTQIERGLKALEEAENDLRATMALSATAAEDDLARLTAVYESMKSKEAAILFEEMSPDFAAGFLARMRPDAAAAIMAGLEPATAYSISVVMAGRNANAKTE